MSTPPVPSRLRARRPCGAGRRRLATPTILAGLAAALGLVVVGCAAAPAATTLRPGPMPGAPDSGLVYVVLVANEASDLVSEVRFSPGRGASVGTEAAVGMRTGEIEEVSGLRGAPDGSRWYVSLARGVPNGRVWKMDTATDTLLGSAEVGGSPGALDITPDGRFLFVANRGLDGPPVPSSVSVVYTATMTEVARPVTCIRPAGSRLDAAARRVYSTCRHSDQLVEIDTRSYGVSRRLSLRPGQEHEVGPAAARDHTPHGLLDSSATCLPSWVETGRGVAANRFVYVTCASSGDVDIVDTRAWSVVQRVQLGGSPAEAAATPDGSRLVVALRDAQSVAVVDLRVGRELARVRTSAPVPHGVVVSPDGRYAFVSNEAAGSDVGTVDVIDLRTPERVASTAVRFQPGPIAFWGLIPG